MKATLWDILIAGVISSGLWAGQAVTFEKIPIPEGMAFIRVTDQSADGTIAVGTGSGAGFSYTQAISYSAGQTTLLTGMVEATAISDDGSIIVGSIRHPYVNRTEAAMWQDGEVAAWLGYAGLQDSHAYGISGDGQTIVMGDPSTLFVWKDGIMTPLGDHLGYFGGISFDGEVIVGQSVGDFDDLRPVVWSNGTVEELELLPGDVTGRANDVSRDGTIVVGDSSDSDYYQRAVRWEEGAAIELQGISGWENFSAKRVSGDGSVILGLATMNSDIFFECEPLVWSKETNYAPRTLNSILVKAGFEPDIYESPWLGMDLSDDGNTILVGHTRIKLNSPAWAGYPIQNAEMDVDTGGFMGWINVFHQDMIWCYDLGCWVYCPEASVTESGAWVYVLR